MKHLSKLAYENRWHMYRLTNFIHGVLLEGSSLNPRLNRHLTDALDTLETPCRSFLRGVTQGMAGHGFYSHPLYWLEDEGG